MDCQDWKVEGLSKDAEPSNDQRWRVPVTSGSTTGLNYESEYRRVQSELIKVKAKNDRLTEAIVNMALKLHK